MKQGPMTAREWMDFHERVQRRIVNLTIVAVIALGVLVLIK